MSATQTHQQHHLQDGKGSWAMAAFGVVELANNIRYPETTCHMRNGDFVMSKKNHHPSSPYQLLALLPQNLVDWHLWSIVQRTGLRLRKTPIINPHSRVGVFFPERSINLVA